MRKKIWKAILYVLSIVIIIVTVSIAIVVKATNQYRPSVYNYESYLSPQIIQKLKTKYNYKEFKEISEFTQAITQEKAIAGVGSDFQAAQLIIDKKIQKFDFELIYGPGSNEWENRKKYYTPNTVKHLEDFDALILSKLDQMEKEGKDTGFIIDRNQSGEALNYRIKNSEPSKFNGGWDHFYDYILPYYTQDKGIAYNINEKTRPNLNVSKAEEQLNEATLKFEWQQIFNVLKGSNYEHFGWTNAYLDNLMIGAMTYGEGWEEKFTKNVKGTQLFNFGEDNYKIAIDSFNRFIKSATGHDIKDTKFNFLTSDGLELLNHLIEPKNGRSDAAVMYNGDALDAYYSEDNFSTVEEGNVRFVRPKYNYILMDNWILSKGLTKEEADTFTRTLGELLYHNNQGNENYDSKLMATSIAEVETQFFKEFKEQLSDSIIEEQKQLLINELTPLTNEEKSKVIDLIKEEFADADITQDSFVKWNEEKFDNFINNPVDSKNYEWFLIMRDNLENGYKLFEDVLADLFSDSSISDIANFDYVSYTPTNRITYEFVLKWYFAGDETAITIFEQPESTNEYKLFSYPIIDNNLRTKISTYYYETTKS